MSTLSQLPKSLILVGLGLVLSQPAYSQSVSAAHGVTIVVPEFAQFESSGITRTELIESDRQKRSVGAVSPGIVYSAVRLHSNLSTVGVVVGDAQSSRALQTAPDDQVLLSSLETKAVGQPSRQFWIQHNEPQKTVVTTVVIR